MDGVFITRPELHAKSRRDYNKKISAETMFVEQQMRNKLPMNKFRLAIRRTFLIIACSCSGNRFSVGTMGQKEAKLGLHGV